MRDDCQTPGCGHAKESHYLARDLASDKSGVRRVEQVRAACLGTWCRCERYTGDPAAASAKAS